MEVICLRASIAIQNNSGVKRQIYPSRTDKYKVIRNKPTTVILKNKYETLLTIPKDTFIKNFKEVL